MRFLSLFFLVWLGLTSFPLGAKAGPNSKATVLIFVGSHCPCSDPHRQSVSSLVQKYEESGVKFYAIFSNKGETKELAERFMRNSGWNFSPILDSNGKWMKKYGAKLTPEVFLLDAKETVAYHGAIDDSVLNVGQIQHPYLQTALEQLLSGQKIFPKETKAYGCYITPSLI